MNSNITRDARILEIMQESTCFGIVHSDDVPECKQCDVKAQCKSKTEAGMVQPEPPKRKFPNVEDMLNKQVEDMKEAKKAKSASPTVNPMEGKDALLAGKPTSKAKPTTKPSTKKPKSEKPPKSTPKRKTTSSGSDNMPIFKDMDINELSELAAKRNVEWKEYGNASITRMRLIMALKSSY